MGRWVWCFKERGGSERGELKVEVEKERERRDMGGGQSDSDMWGSN